MKIKVSFYSFFFLVSILVLSSCSAYKKVEYLQTSERRLGKTVDLSSYRRDNFIRFQPDDILAITVNVPGEPAVAAEYNLPLLPSATTENSTESSVSQGIGRQAYLVKKDGKITFPVLGEISVVGLTQGELEEKILDLLMLRLNVPPVVTVRLQNFRIYVLGEVTSQGTITTDKDHINVMEALALAGGVSIGGKREDIDILRPTPDGGYKRISIDVTTEDIISSPYYFLHQNDQIIVKPIKQRTHQANISPMFGISIGLVGFAMSLITYITVLSK